MWRMGLIVSLVWGVVSASECPMQIVDTQQIGEKTTLTITHAEGCELEIEATQEKIVLLSKRSRDHSTVDEIVALAKSKLGSTYLYGASGPAHFDCSGFVYYLFKQSGVTLPRTSLMQSQSGEKLERGSLKRGDILFFDTHARGHINHSALYLGDGKFIHASSGKANAVTVSELDKGFYLDKFRWGIRKFPNSAIKPK